MMLQYILDNTARPLFTGPPGYDPPQQVRDIWNCSEVTRCSTATSSGYPFPLATKGSVAATLLDSPDVSTEDSDEAPAWQEDVDTVTIKNIPCRCRRGEILEAIFGLGFSEDMLVYLHLPVKQGKGSFNLGYCFVGFRTPELARRFRDRAEGFRFQSRQSAKIIRVEPARVQAREGAQKTMHGEVTWFGQQPQPTACLGAPSQTYHRDYIEMLARVSL
mmetsp:Transcript_78015/g.140761  ORF Transcript_78015/g.140761 Transcript_78015/m.140761 type:complete len:218 (-) Transcript_78015:47-700(-)